MMIFFPERNTIKTRLYGLPSSLYTERWRRPSFLLVGADLVEVSPSYDHAEITGIAAADLVHDFLSMLVLQTKRESHSSSHSPPQQEENSDAYTFPYTDSKAVRRDEF